MVSPTTRTFVRIVYYVADVIIVTLAIRIVLLFFGANAGNIFVQFIYRFSDMFLAPFRNIFPSSMLEGAKFEWSTLLAMAIYGIGTYLINRLIITLTTTSDETDMSYEEMKEE